jgi:hypothetical protein
MTRRQHRGETIKIGIDMGSDNFSHSSTFILFFRGDDNAGKPLSDVRHQPGYRSGWWPDQHAPKGFGQSLSRPHRRADEWQMSDEKDEDKNKHNFSQTQL